MTNKSLNLAISGALAISLAVPVMADQKVKTKSNIKNDRVQGTFSDGCSISSAADSVTITTQLSNLWADGSEQATVVLAIKAPAKGGPVIATYDIKVAKGRMASGATSQACDNSPAAPAQDHAINTKGAGQERTGSIVHKDLAALTCVVSGDAGNPAVVVHVVLPPPSGKATFKEFTVTKKTDTAATWRDSAVDGQNTVVCLTESGEASSVAVKASWNLKENVK